MKKRRRGAWRDVKKIKRDRDEERRVKNNNADEGKHNNEGERPKAKG